MALNLQVHIDTRRKKQNAKTPKTNHKFSITPRLRYRAEWTAQLLSIPPTQPAPTQRSKECNGPWT